MSAISCAVGFLQDLLLSQLHVRRLVTDVLLPLLPPAHDANMQAAATSTGIILTSMQSLHAKPAAAESATSTMQYSGTGLMAAASLGQLQGMACRILQVAVEHASPAILCLDSVPQIVQTLRMHGGIVQRSTAPATGGSLGGGGGGGGVSACVLASELLAAHEGLTTGVFPRQVCSHTGASIRHQMQAAWIMSLHHEVVMACVYPSPTL